MTLDELIDTLQEAKEHGVLGKTEVKVNVPLTVNDTYLELKGYIVEGALYDNKRVTIEIAEENG